MFERVTCVETGQDLNPYTSSSLPVLTQNHRPALREGSQESALRSSECKVRLAGPRDQGQGGLSEGPPPELWLRKLLCKTWKTGSGRAAPTPAARSPMGLPCPRTPGRVGVSGHSLLTFTDEGTECSKSGACPWGLRTVSLKHLLGPLLWLSPAQDLCRNAVGSMAHTPRETSQGQAFPPPSLCQTVPGSERGGRPGEARKGGQRAPFAQG